MNVINSLYYINLDYRVDRNLQTLEWLEEAGFPEEKIHRIQAVYTPRKGHIGCLLSHIKSIEEFLKTGERYCMILEDDYQPVNINTFWNSIDELFKSKKEFDIVLLSYNVLESEPTDISFLHKVKKSYTSSGYILSREFAPRLLDNFKEAVSKIKEEELHTSQKANQYCLDVYWEKLMPESKWYCFYPRLGYQRDSFSDIDHVYANRSV